MVSDCSKTEEQELARSQEQPLLSEVNENEVLSFEDDADSIALERLRARRER